MEADGRGVFQDYPRGRRDSREYVREYQEYAGFPVTEIVVALILGVLSGLITVYSVGNDDSSPDHHDQKNLREKPKGR